MVCTFPLVLKNNNLVHRTLSLSLLREFGADPCPAGFHQLSSPCMAKPAEADRTAQLNKGCFARKYFQAVQ